MKVSESPYGMSESYSVKFWCTNESGFDTQIEETFYSTSKGAHKKLELFAMKKLSEVYKNVRIITISYH